MKKFRPVLIAGYLLLLSCAAEQPTVRITQYTDPSHVTAVTIYNDMVYCATKGGLVRWDLAKSEYTVYTTANGLPSNFLTDLIVDTDNRLWVGSSDGIGIFDGSSWEYLGLSSGLPSAEINDLSLSGDGTVWAATPKGMASFDGGGFRIFKDDAVSVDLDIHCIFFDKGGNMWVGTRENGGYMKIDDTWRHTTSKEGLTANEIHTLAQSWDNSVWAASWAGVTRWDGFGWQVFKPFQRLGTFDVRKLYGTQERLWFFTSNGIHASRGSDWIHLTEDDGLLSNDTVSGHLVSDDLLYVGTAYGLSVVENQVPKNYVVPGSHFGNNCMSVAVDEGGRVWAGTWETGLNLYDSGRWNRITGDDEKMLATVRSTVFGPEGMMVFNTTGGVVFRDESGWKHQNRKNGISGDDVRCGVYDREGRYWIGTSTGISVLTKGGWKRFRKIHGLPSEDVWSCELDADGAVWFGTTEGIVTIADDVMTDRTNETGLDSADVRSMLSQGGGMYFGTESGHLIEYRDGEWDVSGNRFLKTDKGIYSIAMDTSGALWLGTNGDGVIRVEGEDVRHYTMADGLPSNYVRSLAFRDGVLWMACYGGFATLEGVTQ